MSDPSKTIVRAVQTCDACPSQWDAVTVDGTELYLRFRHGYGRAALEHSDETVSDFSYGDPLLGVISLSKFCELAGLAIDPDAQVKSMSSEPWWN